jgi:hypothetical protein
MRHCGSSTALDDIPATALLPLHRLPHEATLDVKHLDVGLLVDPQPQAVGVLVRLELLGHAVERQDLFRDAVHPVIGVPSAVERVTPMGSSTRWVAMRSWPRAARTPPRARRLTSQGASGHVLVPPPGRLDVTLQLAELGVGGRLHAAPRLAMIPEVKSNC